VSGVRIVVCGFVGLERLFLLAVAAVVSKRAMMAYRCIVKIFLMALFCLSWFTGCSVYRLMLVVQG